MQDCPFVPLSPRTPVPANAPAGWFDLNAAHVGQPFFLAPYGGEELPTVIGAGTSASNETKLTFRAPDYHFYGYDIRLSLYAYDGSEITYIDPNSQAGSVASPVYLRFYSTADRYSVSNREVHWSTVAGDARKPHLLAAPVYIGPGQTLDVMVRNGSLSQQFVIAMEFCGVRLSAGPESDRIRRALPKELFVAAERQYAKPVTRDPDLNIRAGGIPRFLPLASAPVSYTSGTYASPTGAGDQTILTDSRYSSFVCSFTGSTVVGASTTRQADPTANIFVRLFSRRYNQRLMEGWIPYGHVFGDQEHPGWLSTPMVLPENDAIIVQAKNLEGSDVSCNYGAWVIDRE